MKHGLKTHTKDADDIRIFVDSGNGFVGGISLGHPVELFDT